MPDEVWLELPNLALAHLKARSFLVEENRFRRARRDAARADLVKEVSLLTISAAPVPMPAPVPVVPAVLNAVAVAAPQIEAALQLLALLPAGQRGDPAAQAATLLTYARDAGFADPPAAAAALHARAALHEAGARMPLSNAGDGAAFETAGFQELLLFIEELPW